MSAAETENLQSKIAGCWLGKNIGGTLGAPFEGTRECLDLTFYTQPLRGEPEPNDDLDLQLLWLEMAERYTAWNILHRGFSANSGWTRSSPVGMSMALPVQTCRTASSHHFPAHSTTASGEAATEHGSVPNSGPVFSRESPKKQRHMRGWMPPPTIAETEYSQNSLPPHWKVWLS